MIPDPAAVRAACERCDGRGWYDREPGDGEMSCLDCNGTGLASVAPAPATPESISGFDFWEGGSSGTPAPATPAAGERYVQEHANGACMVAIKSTDQDAPYDVVGMVTSRADVDLLAHGHARLAALERERDTARALLKRFLTVLKMKQIQPPMLPGVLDRLTAEAESALAEGK